jgi:hypothetical protein
MNSRFRFCCLIEVSKYQNNVGFRTRLVFQIVQHSRDELLIRRLKEYFDCGFIQSHDNAFYYRVHSFFAIEGKFLPFFTKHRIQGVKLLDFQDWAKAAELMKNKAHLTKEGLYQIRQIKAGMNKGRG